MVMARRAGTCVTPPRSFATATVVFANEGMNAAGASAERQRPLLDELENRGAGQRLGLRRDAEDRIDGHLAIGFAIGPAERLLVDDLAVLHHEGHDSRHAAGIDILLQPRSMTPALEASNVPGCCAREGGAKKSGQGDRSDSHTARIVPQSERMMGPSRSSYAPDAVCRPRCRVRGHRPGATSGGRPDSLGVPELLAQFKVPAVSVAVIRDFKIDWARAWGVKSARTGEAATVDTLFQAASISKPVAAMASLRAVQDGRFTLDQDINTILKSWRLPRAVVARRDRDAAHADEPHLGHRRWVRISRLQPGGATPIDHPDPRGHAAGESRRRARGTRRR